MAVGWWQPAPSFHATGSLCHESLAPWLNSRHCTHPKGVRKAGLALMKGILWSCLQPAKPGERGCVFILCSPIQPHSTPACLRSWWLLPVDKYVLLQSISSIFKTTDYTCLHISQDFLQEKLWPFCNTPKNLWSILKLCWTSCLAKSLFSILLFSISKIRVEFTISEMESESLMVIDNFYYFTLCKRFDMGFFMPVQCINVCVCIENNQNSHLS